MKEFKGTKGEWHVCGHSVYSGSNEVNIACLDSSLYSINSNELKANAKLIASAPELLKALQLIMSNSNDHAMIRIAHKAISKALGE